MITFYHFLVQIDTRDFRHGFPYVFIHTNISIYTQMYVNTHKYTHIIYVYAHRYVYIHTNIRVCILIYVEYTHIQTNIRIYIQIYVYIDCPGLKLTICESCSQIQNNHLSRSQDSSLWWSDSFAIILYDWVGEANLSWQSNDEGIWVGGNNTERLG